MSTVPSDEVERNRVFINALREALKKEPLPHTESPREGEVYDGMGIYVWRAEGKAFRADLL